MAGQCELAVLEHHVAKECSHEDSLGRPSAVDPGARPGETEPLGDARERLALTPCARQVDPAQERGFLVARRRERTTQEDREHTRELVELLGEDEEFAAALRIGFPQQELGQDRLKLLSHGVEAPQRGVPGVGEASLRVRPAEELDQAARRQGARQLDKTIHQIDFGHGDVDRCVHAELVDDLIERAAELSGVLLHVAHASAEQARRRDGDDDAIDGHARARTAHKAQKRAPLAAVSGLFGARVAARGVEQDGFVGEPEVAVACRSRRREPRELGGELEARFVKQRTLAASRLANHQVPGQCVDAVAPQPGTAQFVHHHAEAI